MMTGLANAARGPTTIGSSEQQASTLATADSFKSGLRDTVDQIERYAQDRLKTIFRYVSDPLPLLNDRDSKIFSLFCLSNSSSPKALGLIRNGVTSVLKKFAGR